MNTVKRFTLLAVGMLLIAGLLTAQQTTAKIFGTVQLEDGSLVPGVSVEATSPKLVGKATAVTDENGTFKLFNLAPGTYKLVFKLEGFQTVVRDNIPLVAEQTANLKVEMKLGNLTEVITITGQVAPDRRQERGQGHDPDQGALQQPAQGPRLQHPGHRRPRRLQ